MRVIFSYFLAQLLRASNPFHLAAVLCLPKHQKREKMQEIVFGGKTTLKAMGGEGEPLEKNGAGSQKAKKLSSTGDKMTPESPTCAIDADQLIMRDKIDLERAGQKKDKVAGFSAFTPGHDDNLLFAKVAPSILKTPPPPPQPAPAVTPSVPYSEPVPVPSCTTDLNDSNLLLLVQLDRPGRAAEAKCAPAVLEPAPAAFAAAPVLAPVVHSAPASAGPALALGDSNFLLLAEFAHVVRDTLALRGIQVQDFRSTLLQRITGLDPKHVFQGAALADRSIGMDDSFDKEKVWNGQRISSVSAFSR